MKRQLKAEDANRIGNSGNRSSSTSLSFRRRIVLTACRKPNKRTSKKLLARHRANVTFRKCDAANRRIETISATSSVFGLDCRVRRTPIFACRFPDVGGGRRRSWTKVAWLSRKRCRIESRHVMSTDLYGGCNRPSSHIVNFIPLCSSPGTRCRCRRWEIHVRTTQYDTCST